MINKKTWAFICLAVAMLVSCRNGQGVKNDGTVDSLVTRTHGEVWGFMKAGLYPPQKEIKFLTKQIYPVDASKQSQAANQQWQAILATAIRDSQQVYLTKTFDQASAKAIINNEKQQTTTINALLGSLRERSANGIVVDFGLIKAKDAERYTKFIKKLADQLHSEKLTLGIITPPINEFVEKDIVAIAEASDYLLFDFDIFYGTGGDERNPAIYPNGKGNVINIMTKTLSAPIAISKIMLILPSDDWNFANDCKFALRVGLAGVAVKYTGQKNDQMVTDSLKAKFQYVDTIKVKR